MLRRGRDLAAGALRLARQEIAILAVIVVVAGGLWTFAHLAEEVGDGDTDSFDRTVVLGLRNPADLSDPIGPPWFEEVMRDVTALGSHFAVIFVTLAVIGYLLLVRKRGAALLVFASVSGGMVLSSMLKLGFERARPDLVPHGVRVFSASFPSGHATLSAITYLTLGTLLTRLKVDRPVKAYFLGLAVVLTIMVGCSRVYLGVHWPTDVLAGWAIGAAWAMGIWLIALWLQRRGKVEHSDRS